MTAVTEPALGSQPIHLNKTKTPPIEPVDGRREVAYAGRVDQVAAAREIEHSRRGGGVASFLFAHEVANLDFGVRDQAIHERGLPNPGLTDQRGDLAGTDFQHGIDSLAGLHRARETTDSRPR